MPRYTAKPHENQEDKKPKWCICVDGIPDLALGLFDTPGGAEAKAQEMSASFCELERWIKPKGAERSEVDINYSDWFGPIKKLDEFHVIQKFGRAYAIHVIDKLDAVPTLNDSSTEIKYRDGRGTVTVRAVGIRR